MIEHDPIGNDRRARRRSGRLGTSAACANCGEDRLPLLECHHAGGAENDADLLVVLCRNCHALHTEAQLVAGVKLGGDARAMPERLEAMLRSLAAFFALLADVLCRWADQLAAFVAQLDETQPGWRALPPAE
jgi:hypothetical protein